MAIEVDSAGTAGPPAIKFPEIGSYATLGIVDVRMVPSRDYDTGELATWDDGSPKEHPYIIGLVTASNGATVGKDDDERPVVVGELVSIHAEGGRWYPYRDAKREFAKENDGAGVSVGSVLSWKFDSEEPPKNKRHNPQKVYLAKLRKATGDDGDLVARCEAAYYEQRKPIALDDAPAPSSSTSAPAAAGDPFA
jgi:hypothetical protein